MFGSLVVITSATYCPEELVSPYETYSRVGRYSLYVRAIKKLE